MRRVQRTALLTLAAAMLTAAAPKAATLQLAPYTPAYEPKTVDERGLWAEADEEERKLRDSPLVLRDEALNGYVRRVFCNTVGADRCKSVRIYILEVPDFNAMMMPNGTMVIWSGLLLRTRSEAELASVLGHEFAHFELRHSLSAFKRQRTTTDILSWVGVVGGLSGTNTGGLQWALVGSFFRFNREQEKEADRLGVQYLASSTYPTLAAPDLWVHVMAENDATAIGRKRKPKQRYSAGFFATHPTSLNRATDLLAETKKFKSGGDAAVAGHREGIAKFLPLFLADQIKLNDFGGSEYLLGELAGVSGWTGDLQFARGELYRARGNPRDLVSAASFYGEAIKLGYTAPEARRNLGLALLRSGQATDGRSALADYLRMKPDASDAKAISALLTN
jgi:beta-barrel assembly-enhancing protease